MLRHPQYPGTLDVNYRHPLMRGCTGFWLLNEHAGTRARDLSIHGRHGVLTSTGEAMPASVPGPRKMPALRFGDTNYAANPAGSGVVLPVSVLPASWMPVNGGAVSCWIKLGASVGDSGIAGAKQSPVSSASEQIFNVAENIGLSRTTHTSIGDVDTVFAWHLRASGSGAAPFTTADLVSITAATLGTGWVHVFFLFETGTGGGGANRLRIGYNGRITSSIDAVSTNYLGGGAVIGGGNGARAFSGDIADVRVWDRAITEDEAWSLFAHPMAVFQPRRQYWFSEPLAVPGHPHATPLIASHCEVGKERMLQQFKGKDRFEGVICGLGDRAQEIEQAAADVLAYRSRATAIGAQLDRVGENLGLERQGLDDDEYRARLAAQTMVIASNGRADELLEILVALDAGYDPDAITLVEHFSAALVMTVLVPAGGQLTGEAFAFFLKRAASAAVRLILHFEEVGIDLFEWSESLTGAGWDEGASPGSGGTWTDAV